MQVWQRNKFESFVVVGTIRLKREVNFFIRELWKSFTFLPSDFIIVVENF